MLSYRHGYHAGNFADVLKHAVLGHLLVSERARRRPMLVVDTHAGAGGYRLDDPYALKTREFEAGIGRILAAEAPPPLLAPLLGTIRAMNPDGGVFAYPGSPALIRYLTGPDDRLVFAELHSTDSATLEDLLAEDRRAEVARVDGFDLLLDLLPPPEERAVVLIDPSYEIKSDFDRVPEAVASAWRLCSGATYLVWYPVIDRARTERMIRAMRTEGLAPLHRVELCQRRDGDGPGLTGAGLVIVNAPASLLRAVETGLPWLARAMRTEGRARCEPIG